MRSSKANWVRQWEHPALSFFSVVFSAVSAHAILWFYSTLDTVHMDGDFMQPFIKWGLALAFTGFGYLSSRGLAHRLLRRERVGAYFLICIVLEIVEVSTNFMYSAVAIQHVGWLQVFSGALHTCLLGLMYTVLPIVPVVTIVLAWVDMDLSMQKEGPTPGPFVKPGVRVGQVPPPVRMSAPPAGYRASAQNAPASYGQGYTGVPRVAEEVPGARPGGFHFPFARRGAAEQEAQPKDRSGARTLLLDPDKQLASTES